MAEAGGQRIGVDLGGTKIEAVLLGPDSRVTLSRRMPTPSGDYQATVRAVSDLVSWVEAESGLQNLPVGICTPGALCPVTGLLKNANSTCLNGQPLDRDFEQALGRPIRMANDADCLAVSEANDGAGAGAATVFAVIIGTGVGGGIARHGQLLDGPNAIAGEWGHNPLPWPTHEELPGERCWCGQSGCLETWVSGPALARNHRQAGGDDVPGETIVERSAAGDSVALAALTRYESRLGRALASVINLLDPDVIVLGGGLSRIDRLYTQLPPIIERYVFTRHLQTRLLPAQHGDSSGVRGAAWLWPLEK